MAELRQNETNGSEADEGALISALLQAPGPDGKARAVVEVTQVWGDVRLDQKQFGVGRAVTVGATARAALRLGGVDVVSVPAALAGFVGGPLRAAWAEDFFAPDASGVEIVSGAAVIVPPGWAARVYVGGARVAGTSSVVALVGDTRVVLEAEGLRFVIRLADAGRRVVEPIADRIDWTALSVGALALGLIATLGLVVQRDVRTSTDAMAEAEAYELKFAADPPKEPTRAATAGKEGKLGEPNAKKEKARGSRGGHVTGDPKPSAGDALTVFDDSGLQALLGGPGLSAKLGREIAGLEGPQGAQLGNHGLGRRGDGFGAAGDAEGLGGFPGGERGDWGPGGPGKATKPQGKLGVAEAEVLTIGSLDPALIDEVVKRHLSQIRYCYSRQLQLADQGALGGKIVIRFTIARDGTVSASNVKSSTMGSEAVETCVARRFNTMKFPQPKAGIVVVSYPFVFQPG